MAIKEVRRIKTNYADLLLSKRNAIACGVGYKEVGGIRTDKLCVLVSVAKKVPKEELAPGDLVPQALEGIRTDVQETGTIRALQGHTSKWRPAPGGELTP